MRGREFVFAIAIAASLFATVRPAVAQKSRKDWTSVQALAPGRVIRVRTGKLNVLCVLREADPDGLTCEHGISITFNRAEVHSVKIPIPNPHHARSLLIGGAVVAGIGAVVGVVDTASNNYFAPKDQQIGLGCGALEGAGVAVGVAALVDFWPRNETVYKAR